MKSCENCKWCSCKHYGYPRPICDCYIPDESDRKE